jgi:hypothetical protein
MNIKSKDMNIKSKDMNMKLEVGGSIMTVIDLLKNEIILSQLVEDFREEKKKDSSSEFISS